MSALHLGVLHRSVPFVLIACCLLAAASAARPAGDGENAARPRYCPVCGAQNPSDGRFCLKDGVPLPEVDPARFRAGFVRSPATFSPEEIQQVMDRVARSVVRIRVRTRSTYRFPVTYYKDEEAEYFNRAMVGRIQTSDNDARLAGSGFVISQDGDVVTNAHVASPSGMTADLTAETSDGRTYPLRLVGLDAASDLALLKLEDGAVPPLSWGDSNAIRAGQETWAIGNPLDIGISATRGTIAGVSGMRVGLNQIEAFVHSDAHITHGNSGGPLVDVRGQVLGVNDITYSEAKGQGYAIPSRMARLVIERLRTAGRYERGYLGLHVRPVDSDNMRKFGLTRTDGAVVEAVLKDAPAEAAGFRPGDVLVGINGRQATSTYLLQEGVSSVGPGAAIKISVDRHGQAMEIPVRTILRPPAPRIDPLADLLGYLRIVLKEDSKKKEVIIGDPHRSRRAPGLYQGRRVKSVLPAQDWPEEPITLNYYKTRAKPVEIRGLDDLRRVLERAYVGGRMAATFEIDYPTEPIASVAFDETWQIIL